MRTKYTKSILEGFGSLFDVAGFFPAAAHARIQEKRKRRAKSVDEAMRSDMEAIAGDMRRAMDKGARVWNLNPSE